MIKSEFCCIKFSSDNLSLQNAVNQITLQGFQTFTAAALRVALIDFQKSPERFRDPNTAKILILLTDGKCETNLIFYCVTCNVC